MPVSALLHLQLESYLHKLCRMRDGYQYLNAHDSIEYVIGGHGVTQSDVYLKSIFRGGTSQASTFPHTAQEVLYQTLHVYPCNRIVRLKNAFTSTIFYSFFYENPSASDIYITPIQ